MNSATQSKRDEARELLAAAEDWSAAGWRLASPAWFPLLCVAVSVLASVPIALLLDNANGAGIYWLVAAPVCAVASGWFFATRRVQPPAKVGAIALVTGIAMLGANLALAWANRGAWADVIPWLVLGVGLGIFATAWRSISTAAVALTCVLTAVVVAITDPADSYPILAAIIGCAAALAVFVELVRTDPGRAHD